MIKCRLNILLAVALVAVSCNRGVEESSVSPTKLQVPVVNTELRTPDRAGVENKDTGKTAGKVFAAGVRDSLFCGGAALYVPKGSMSESKEITITPLDKGQLPHVPASVVNVTKGCDGFRFLPHGEHFINGDAIMAIPYDTLKIPQGYTVSDIRTYYYSESLKRWEELKSERVDTTRQLAYASTSHFTDVINGILKVPESPETGCFTPTFISDFKRVAPLSGMSIMEAPVPSATGEANLAYRFHLPAGRAGMTPDISLCYSSGTGSGWVGYGFSIPMEKIEIDTRWGTPQFSEEYETECYLYRGMQFTKKAHNHTVIDSTQIRRKGGDVSFRLRVDDEFLNIVRHGSTPRDYSWTITDKSGTEKTFTGFDGEMAEVNSKSGRGESNQIEWVLTKVKDRNGNTIEYSYQSVFGTLYPSVVRYAGHEDNGDKGAYEVRFIYPTHKIIVQEMLQQQNGQPVKHIRTDAKVNRRLGVRQCDFIKLDSIAVLKNGNMVRSYGLKYATGVFSKTLLKSVTEHDSEGEQFYSHSFDYYNEVADGKLFHEAETWNSAGMGFRKGQFFSAAGEGFNDELTMLGGASSKGFSAGGGMHVGVGFGPFLQVYAGVSYQYCENESNGQVTLSDINGDGLPDVVYARKDTLRYRANLGLPEAGDTDTMRFGEERNIKGVNKYSNGKSETHTLLVDAGAQLFFISGNVCYSHNWQSSRNTIYLQDFNADGLIDIAYKGKVMFNHIDDNGDPEFTLSSVPTPCPILGHSVPIDESFMVDVEGEADKLRERFPLHDVVRVWRAPYTGKVRIADSSVKVSDQSVDGVTASIQLRGENPVWRKTIRPGESAGTGRHTVQVNEGDRIYFRVQAVDDAVGDEVEWSPEIEYANIQSGVTDSENGTLKKYSASREFLFCGVPDVPLYKTGTIHVSAPFSKGDLSDDIALVVRKNMVLAEGGDTVVLRAVMERRHLNAHDIHSDEPMDIYYTVDDIDVKGNAYLSFTVECASQINWENIRWRPVATYSGEPEPFMYVAPQYTMYNKHVVVADGVKFSGGTTVVKPVLWCTPVNEDKAKRDTLKVNFSLKDADGDIYYSGPYSADMEIPINVSHTTTIYGSFHANMEMNPGEAVFIMNGSAHNASVYCAYNDESMGHLYKGWGQFAYKGEAERMESPIVETDLAMRTAEYKEMTDSFDKKTKPEDIKIENIDADKLKSLPTVNDQTFYIMSLVPKDERYESVAKDSHVSATGIAPSRMGKQSIEVEVPSYPQTPPDASHPSDETACPFICLSGEGDGVTGSAGAIASIGGGYTRTSSNTDQFLADINGDGYPDWISRSNNTIKTQFTQSDGRLSERKAEYDFTPQSSVSTATNLNSGLSISSTTPVLGAAIGKKDSWSSFHAQKASAENENSSMSLGIDGSFGDNELESNCEFIDVNGDGLPDLLYSDGNVRYNMGDNTFSDMANYVDGLHVYVDKGKTAGAGVGVNVSICGQACAGGGASGSRTESETAATWRDMNGDGLPDVVVQGGGTTLVAFNTGTTIETDGARNIKMPSSSNVSVSGGVSANVAVPISAWFVTITPSVTGSYSGSVSRTHTMITDIDGDGYPDIVSHESPTSISVHRSKIGNTNLLRSVNLPTGAQIELNYKPSKHSYGMPMGGRVLSIVEIKGGDIKDSITYSGGFYNRCERAFCGYDTVSVSSLDTKNSNAVYRTVKTAYMNHSFYTRGLPSERAVYNADGKKLSSTAYTYTLKGDSAYMGAGIFPALTREVTTLYGEDDNLVKTKVYDYDEIGNMTSYSVDGDLTATITYHTGGAVRNVPEKITVGSLAERSSEIDKHGNITKITVSTGDVDAVYDMEYDSYGNMLKITRPADENGERAWVKTEYDSELHTFPVKVADCYGGRTETTYHTLFDCVKSIVTANSDAVDYTYDSRGRVESVITRKDKEDGRSYTLRFEYNTNAAPINAVTYHNTPDGEFAVHTYIDKVGRPLSTVRPSAIYDGGGVSIKNVTSGMGEYDAMGRRVTEYKPTTDSGSKDMASHTEYDELDRILSVTMPNGAKTTYSYSVIADDVTGKTVLSTTVTDPNGNKTARFSDDRGRTVATVKYHNGEQIRTTTDYDALDRPVKVTHPNGAESSYTYNKAGNLVSRTTPDGGTERMTYTPMGLLKSRLTATGERVEYTYDRERLSKVRYPDSPQDSVTYIYADSTAADRQIARIIEVRDPSGTESYTYGDMGNVVKTLRTINIDTLRHLSHTYVYGAEYDSWGRVRTMIYPDGEEVLYYYYPTGELKSIIGENLNREDIYIKETGYTIYGETAYRKMGNGSEHVYTFDDNERLETSTLNFKNETLADNTYTYDKADNITGIAHKGGGRYMQHYEYDDMNRLIKATGVDNTAVGDTPYSHYSMSVAYNVMSSPVTIEKDINGTFRKNDYLYGTNQPNAPVQVGGVNYTYSASGNPLTITGAGVDRSLTWDAENRLCMIEDNENGTLHLYTYNHAGERALKRFGTGQTMAVNGRTVATLLDVGENYSAYVSPYFTENNNRYTKHYYAGTMRLASKIGGAVYKGVDGEQGGEGSAGTESSANGSKGADSSKDLEPGSTYKAGTDEPDLYYYFTDHLGSTTYITDREEVAQYVAYTPYGETFKEYRNVTPYKFNGKELDQETGYYYYGARYYDPQAALWFGTDPLQYKYPMNSPYTFCNGNPICRIDYNGMDWYSVNNEDGTQSGKWFDSSESVIIDGDLTYNHVGKTMSGFNEDGSFVYGAQDGKLYSSASLDEVTISGDQSAVMTRSIHSAQNDFLSSDYTKMATGLIGGIMAGPALLEGGIAATKAAYGAILPHVPYYAMEGITIYNELRTILELSCSTIESSVYLSIAFGLFDGYYRQKYDIPFDLPYPITNPLFQLSSDFSSTFFSLLKKYEDH